MRLLPTEHREKVVQRVKTLAVATPDADFLTTQSIRDFFTKTEIEEIMSHVESRLIPVLDDTLDAWENNHSSDEEADSYYSPLLEALEAFEDYFGDEEKVQNELKRQRGKVERLIEEFEQPKDNDDDDKETYDFSEPELKSELSDEPVLRRIFDDIDA